MTPGPPHTLGRSLRHKMGTALYLNGDIREPSNGSRRPSVSPGKRFDETAGKAHYSLGVLMASSGRGAAAIEHLSAAVRFSPNYVEAYIALGDALRRAGRVEASMEPYVRRCASARRRPTPGSGAGWPSSASGGA